MAGTQFHPEKSQALGLALDRKISLTWKAVRSALMSKKGYWMGMVEVTDPDN